MMNFECVLAAGDLRLTLGSPHCGRLEIFWNDTWGTVNGSGFGDTNRDVACRQLGFQ
jgi:Scavenger receptor cysteine-rich domain